MLVIQCIELVCYIGHPHTLLCFILECIKPRNGHYEAIA